MYSVACSLSGAKPSSGRHSISTSHYLIDSEEPLAETYRPRRSHGSRRRLPPCDDLEAGVQCSLRDARLAEYRYDVSDHYIAISYVWGDQSDRRSISVDEKRLDITASLDSALRHVRHDRRVLRIWADGVCINQKDTHDRNRQVRLMGDVYSTAQHTIIFLGLSSPKCDSVLQLIIAGPQPSKESEGNASRTSTRPRDLLDGHEAIVEDEILARPWFTRVWILQELVLSQNPWLQIGKLRIKWHVFSRSIVSSHAPLWKPHTRKVLEHMNDTRTTFITTTLSNSSRGQLCPGESLFDLLQRRRDCGLSDPRDLVCAHLGLVDARTRNIVPIDYDKSVAQVYEDISRLYVRYIGLVNVLSLVEQNQQDQPQTSLPSWALNLSLQWQLRGQSSFGLLKNSYGDQYGRERIAASVTSPVLSMDGRGIYELGYPFPRREKDERIFALR